MKGYHKIGLLFVFLFLIGIFANVNPISAQNSEIKNPGKYVMETISKPDPIDPATNYESFGSGINELIYETLVDYKGNSATDLEGKLATSWEVSDDGLTYTFHLRKGVKFHDGVEFNAYIMKYSLDRAIIMMDPWGPAWMIAQVIKGAPKYMSLDDANVSDAIEYLNAGGIEVVDDYTLKIHLENPYTPFIYALAYRVGSAISPKAVIENEPDSYTTDTNDDTYGMVPLDQWFPDLAKNNDWAKLGLSSDHDPKDSGVVPNSGADSDAAHTWLATHGVGTGPYKLVELKAGETIRFEKNKDWWGKFAPNSPDEIIIKTVNEVDTRLLDLKNGDADQVYVPTTHASEVVDENGNPKVEGIQIFTGPTFTVMFFGMNMNDTLPSQFISESSDSTFDPQQHNRYSWGDAKASAGNPFTALKFRKAFAMSFNYEAFIDQVTNGYAERMEGVIPNGMFGHHDKLIENGLIPSYDPDTAKTLFQEVGWKGTITLGYNEGNEVRKQGSLLLKNAIESMGVGITINVQEMAWPDYLSAVRSRELPIFFLGWAPDYADPDNYAAPFLHGEYGIYAPRINYNNPDLNAKIEQAAKESDKTKREQLYHEIEEMAAKDYPFIYAYQAHRLTVLRSWIYDYEESGSLNPMSSMPNFESINKGKPAATPGFELPLIALVVLLSSGFVLKKRRYRK